MAGQTELFKPEAALAERHCRAIGAHLVGGEAASTLAFASTSRGPVRYRLAPAERNAAVPLSCSAELFCDHRAYRLLLLVRRQTSSGPQDMGLVGAPRGGFCQFRCRARTRRRRQPELLSIDWIPADAAAGLAQLLKRLERAPGNADIAADIARARAEVQPPSQQLDLRF